MRDEVQILCNTYRHRTRGSDILKVRKVKLVFHKVSSWVRRTDYWPPIYDAFLICTPMAKQLAARSQGEQRYYQAAQFPSDMRRHVLRPDYIAPFSHSALHPLDRELSKSSSHIGYARRTCEKACWNWFASETSGGQRTFSGKSIMALSEQHIFFARISLRADS